MTSDAKEPSLELLRTLLEFAERGEVTAAAQALGLDKSGVSRRLGDLRDKYGLVAQRGHTPVLSEKGRTALPAIRALLRQHAQLAGWLKDQEQQTQFLAIATGGFGARFYLPKAICRFSERQPDWQVRVQVRRGRERVLGVADGTFDLAIVSHDAAQIRAVLAGARIEPAALRIEPLAEHLLYLVAGKDTPFGRELSKVLDGQAVPLSMLSAFPLVGLDIQSGIRRQIEARFRSTKARLSFPYEAGGWEAAKEYARHGLGAAVVPFPLLTADDRKQFIVRRLPLEYRIQDSLIDRDGEQVAAQDAMKRALKDATKGLPRGG
jgi:DNA-binding transcriptional LysR family regulator